MTFPVTLGKGKRLFGDGTPSKMLKMVDHKLTAKGTVITLMSPALRSRLPAIRAATQHKLARSGTPAPDG